MADEYYKSSIRNGAGLNEARRATFMLGLAWAPMWWTALSANRPCTPSSEADVHMASSSLQAYVQRLNRSGVVHVSARCP
jgi:hypothetical protein